MIEISDGPVTPTASKGLYSVLHARIDEVERHMYAGGAALPNTAKTVTARELAIARIVLWNLEDAEMNPGPEGSAETFERLCRTDGALRAMGYVAVPKPSYPDQEGPGL